MGAGVMAARPGSTFQPTPPQGGKGGGAVQPTQPQTPYTPIGSQGGKGGRGPIQPQPVQPTQSLPLFNNGVNDAFSGIPGQGGKAPVQPISPQIPFEGTGGGLGIPGQGGKAPGTLANTPTLTTGRPFDFSTVINNIGQTVPRAITPMVNTVAQNVPVIPQQRSSNPTDVLAPLPRPAPAPVQTRGPAPRNMQPMATQGLAALMNKRR